MTFKKLSAAAIAALATLALAACGGDTEVEEATTRTTPQPVGSTDPADWSTATEMTDGLIAAGKTCDDLGVEPDDTYNATCVNGYSDSNYMVSLGTLASRDARVGAVAADMDWDMAVTWDDAWAVVCVGPDSESDCEDLSDAFGSTKEVVDIPVGTFHSSDSEEESDGPSTSFSDGTHVVGTDIEPGTYRNDSETCYWERLSGFSGTSADRITNDFNRGGNSIVTIDPTDAAFKSQNCGNWELVE